MSDKIKGPDNDETSTCPFRQLFRISGLGAQRGNSVEENGLTSFLELDTVEKVR